MAFESLNRKLRCPLALLLLLGALGCATGSDEESSAMEEATTDGASAEASEGADHDEESTAESVLPELDTTDRRVEARARTRDCR